MSAMSVAQVAERWQCSVDAVHDLINAGKLPAFRIGNKVRRVKLAEVERWESGGDTKLASTDLASSTDAPSPSGATTENGELGSAVQTESQPRPRRKGARRSIDMLAAGRY
jgi:excisionase family DNA binding protein